MTEHAAIFTYGQPKAYAGVKERCTILLKRLLALVLVVLLFYVFAPYISAYLLYCVLLLPALHFILACSKRTRRLNEAAELPFAVLGCYLVLPALIVFAGSFNNNHPQIKELSIEIPRKSSALKELSIVYASDFHLGRDDYGVLDRFIAKVNVVHPDIILIGGDLLGGRGNPDLGKLKMQFRRLHAKYGVYAVLGNHDVRQIGRRFVPWIGRDFFSDAGVKLLQDNVENIDNAFYLAGRNCGGMRRKPVEELLRDAPRHLPVLLLDHYPPARGKIDQNGVDLQLSGHTHNGQLFPINYFARLENGWAYGSKAMAPTLFVISSGVHYSDPPVNTQGYSEILFIKAVFRPDMGYP